MTFLSPLAFLWALAALPIIGLYLLKVRQRRLTVPTLLFWDKVFQEKTPQSLFQKLRHPLSLLAQLLLLALLVLALANPLFSSSAQGARKIVLIIDNSASMRATDVSPSRLEAAKSKALGIVDSLRYFDTLAVISVAGEPQIISGMTDRQATLRQRIQAITPTDGPTRIAGAIDLARTLVTSDKNPAIVLISDGAFDPSPALSAPDIQFIGVVPQDASSASSNHRGQNIGITAFQARRSIADPIGYDIFIKAQSFSSKPADCTLEVSLDDALIDAIPLTLAPGQTWQQTLSKASPQSGRLRARLIYPDALETDNLAFASLPGASRHTVDLTGTQSFFLRKAFESIPLIDISSKSPDITVFHKTLPATLPAGNLLIIDPQSSTDLFTHAGPLLNPGIQAESKPSPILANVQFQGVYLPEAKKLQPTPSASPTLLATSLTGEPLLFSFDRPQGRVLVFAGNLDSGDLALRTAFPILLANAASWLTSSNPGFTPGNLTGHSATIPLAPHQPTLTDPSGHTHPVATDASSISTPVLRQAGFWTLQNNNKTIDIPVSLTDARESNLAPTAIPTANPSSTTISTGAPLWFYLLAAGLLFLGVEWFLYQRRWIN